jgi:hypothetical protein
MSQRRIRIRHDRTLRTKLMRREGSKRSYTRGPPRRSRNSVRSSRHWWSGCRRFLLSTAAIASPTAGSRAQQQARRAKAHRIRLRERRQLRCQSFAVVPADVITTGPSEAGHPTKSRGAGKCAAPSARAACRRQHSLDSKVSIQDLDVVVLPAQESGAGSAFQAPDESRRMPDDTTGEANGVVQIDIGHGLTGGGQLHPGA